MIRFYPAQKANDIVLPKLSRFALASIFFTVFSFTSFSQSLNFSNPVLESGVAGQDGAIYRFTKVNDTTDALVFINGRSSALVALVTLDDSTSGYNTAFQPVVTYNNNVATSATDWWMDFGIEFVKTGTTQAATLKTMSGKALDVDGNNDKIAEYVSFYYMQTYSLAANTQMTISNLLEFVNGFFGLIGEKFVGSNTNYPGIDSANTQINVNTVYSTINYFRVRTGAQSTAANTGSTRDYSFAFATPVAPAASLPVDLVSFNATLASKGVVLNWATEKEINFSNFVIERSFDGVEYTDAAMIFTESKGNGIAEQDYSYTDKFNATSQEFIYYRLRMVDADGKFKRSDVRVVRIGKNAETPVVSVYPNPAVNNVFVAVPATWQNKPLSVEVYNNNGQLVKHVSNGSAGQTEMVDVKNLTNGMYIVRVSNGTQTAVQKIVKTN